MFRRISLSLAGLLTCFTMTSLAYSQDYNCLNWSVGFDAGQYIYYGSTFNFLDTTCNDAQTIYVRCDNLYSLSNPEDSYFMCTSDETTNWCQNKFLPPDCTIMTF